MTKRQLLDRIVLPPIGHVVAVHILDHVTISEGSLNEPHPPIPCVIYGHLLRVEDDYIEVACWEAANGNSTIHCLVRSGITKVVDYGAS